MSQQQTFAGSTLPIISNLDYLKGNDGVSVPPDPVTHAIKITANSSTLNNIQGIDTKGNPLLYIENITLTNRIQGITSTIGLTTVDIVTFSPPDVGTYAIECRIAAYNVTSSISAGYSIFCTIRYDGALCHLIGVPDIIENEEGAMSNALVTISASAGNILISGTGYAAVTITWAAVALYTFVGT